jgi:geranylgeranyl reductase family protein
LTSHSGVQEEAEIVVVGAGPAGSTAGALLAELGHEVLLVDKAAFPREKPCGDGVMPPAVVLAKQLGLEETIDSAVAVESIRVVLGHRRQTSTRFDAGRAPLPRCVPRGEFDSALLGAARERGARLLQARVDGLDGGKAEQRLLAVAGGDPFLVRGKVVVAADGATSRLRRISTRRAERPHAYAIRRYFRTERPLAPVLHIDLPLELDGRAVLGYGWVFPLEEHLANVGVGFIRHDRSPAPSLRRLLGVYVSELLTRSARRFGDLEPVGEPMGSPVGIRPRIEVAGSPGLALVGDAAGTTHPLTGEGISFAMRGGEAVAEAVHARLQRGSRRPGRPVDDSAEARLQRSFPQLGVDTASLNRLSMFELNKAPSEVETSGTFSGPFIGAVKRFARESAYETGIQASPAWSALAAVEPALARWLESANDRMLDQLSDGMPFVTEMISASVRSHLGPVYAATVLASAKASAGAGAVSEAAFDAAVAVESVGAIPRLLAMLVDRAPSKRLQVNNALGVLTVDFAATRALLAAKDLGLAAAVAALGQTFQHGCQGSMRDAASRFDAGRDIEDWYEAARETNGAAMVLAARFGALVGGGDLAATEAVCRYGLELGVATRLAEEIVELTVPGGPLPESSGAGLRRGAYPLPVLYAVEAEPGAWRLLAQHAAGQCSAEEVVGLVRESGALERAWQRCLEHGEAAASLGGAQPGGEAMARLARAPAEYLTADASLDAVEAC